MDTSCRGCGAALPPLKHPGQARVWCSRACRLRAYRRANGEWVGADADPRDCTHCGRSFAPSRSNQKYCSPQCGWKHRASQRPKSLDWAAGRYPERLRQCMDCGAEVRARASRICCEDCRRVRKVATNRRKNAKRRGARIGLIKFTVIEVGERDGWRCHLCRRRVDRTLPGTDQRGPTIDHLIPIADGGQDELDNVALAHRGCNTNRRDQGIAQLRLIG